jgi:hypothetical protein
MRRTPVSPVAAQAYFDEMSSKCGLLVLLAKTSKFDDSFSDPAGLTNGLAERRAAPSSLYGAVSEYGLRAVNADFLRNRFAQFHACRVNARR